MPTAPSAVPEGLLKFLFLEALNGKIMLQFQILIVFSNFA